MRHLPARSWPKRPRILVKLDRRLKSAQNVYSLIRKGALEFVNLKSPSSAKLNNEILNWSTLKSGTIPIEKAKELCENLTAMQKNYLQKIFYISNNQNLGLKRTTKILKQIEAQSQQNCTKEEVGIVLCAASVARYTVQYWHDNYKKWNVMKNSLKLKDFPVYVDGKIVGYVITDGKSSMRDIFADWDPNWLNSAAPETEVSKIDSDAFEAKELAAADIGGAVGTMIVLGSGMLTPAGAAATAEALVATGGTVVVGAAIAIAGGAAAASAADAIYQIWGK